MSETIKIFIASDPNMKKAELALEESIRQNTSTPWEITWMRAGDPGFEVSDFHSPGVWDIGRVPGKPYSRKGWATDFTCFRFAIPELCDFQGLAIYMDVDFTVLRDLRDLWNFKMTRPIMSPHGRTDVMLIDCGWFAGKEWWPSITEMQSQRIMIEPFKKTILNDRIGIGPKTWESWDGAGWNGKDGELSNYYCIHYTNMRTQPWKPHPQAFKYPENHPDARVDAIFWKYYNDAVTEKEYND